MSTTCDFTCEHLNLEQCKPGTLTNVALTAAYEADGSPITLPVSVIKGEKDGPVVTMIGCIHGIEVATIEIAHQLRESLAGKLQRGTLILAPLVNPLAYRASSRFTPVDAQDMNRVFPGTGSTITHKLAAFVSKELLAVSDAVIDCHSDNPPSLHFTIVSTDNGEEAWKNSIKMAEAFGYPYVLSHRCNGTISDYCLSQGIACITPEFSFSRRADKLSVMSGARGVKNILSFYGMLDEPMQPQDDVVRFPDGMIYSVVSANRGGGLIVLDKVPGDQLHAGDVVAHIRDMWGKVVEEIVTPWDGWLIANPMQGNQMACTGEKIAYIAHELIEE